MILLNLKVVAILSILFIVSGFVLFLIGLFTQNYNWTPALSMFGIGFGLFLVAKFMRNKQGGQKKEI
jgi:hypothetical membrane protein